MYVSIDHDADSLNGVTYNFRVDGSGYISPGYLRVSLDSTRKKHRPSKRHQWRSELAWDSHRRSTGEQPKVPQSVQAELHRRLISSFKHDYPVDQDA